ncbi:MAG: hypothetical protein PHP02_06910 [Eubacteriales bacterium]|nr:hypothetical protein [Eubacteriales bacterium]
MTDHLKKLTINTALCDMTGLTEESLAPYSGIDINASFIVLSPGAKAMLSRIPVAMNAAAIVQVAEGTKMSIKNGKFEIAAGQAPRQPTLLMVNGKLIIRPGSQETLKGYAGIQVNGKILYPQSLEGLLADVQINGKAVAYPDEAILIDGKLKVDELFILRAKGSLYFVTGSIAITEETLDMRALAQKGVRFMTDKAYITQKALPEALPLFDDEAQITPIPQGFAFAEGAETLDGDLIRQHGNRLFIPGNLVIEDNQEETLNKLEGLIVTGSVTLPQRLQDAFLAAQPQYKKLKTYKGRLLHDRGTLTISLEMLRQHPEGLTVEDCGAVTLEEDISAQDILEMLTLRDCGAVLCHEGQKNALEQVSSDVGAITAIGPGEHEKAEKEDTPHETINTAYYAF